MALKLWTLALVLCLANDCFAVYLTKDFTPSTQTGVEALARARKDVYPKQVLENPESYRDDIVAWVGLVKAVQVFKGRNGSPAARILLEHHYFDWYEDHGAQPELFFLSPRGEGNFEIILGLNDYDRNIESQIPTDTLVVAIGTTKVMIDGIRKQLYVLTSHFELIKKSAYRMDVYDYGREGEPFKKVPGSRFFMLPAHSLRSHPDK